MYTYIVIKPRVNKSLVDALLTNITQVIVKMCTESTFFFINNILMVQIKIRVVKNHIYVSSARSFARVDVVY